MLAPPDCARCPRLCASRKMVVNGCGPEDASIVLVGQGPGRVEEKKLRPFCGWSGDRIEYLLGLAGIDPATVRLENITRCRTPRGKGGDLPPKPEEIESCAPFLLQALQHGPKLVVAIGAPAAKWFLPDVKVSEDHGRAFYVRYSELVERWKDSGHKSKWERVVGSGKEPDERNGTDSSSLTTDSNKHTASPGCLPTEKSQPGCLCYMNATTSCVCDPNLDICTSEQSGTTPKMSAAPAPITIGTKHTAPRAMNIPREIPESERISEAVELASAERHKNLETGENLQQNDINDSIFQDFEIMVVPMLHPAAAHPSRNPSQVTVQIEDWKRLGEVLREGVAKDRREYVLLDEAGLEDIIVRADVLSFDYETDKASNLWQGTFQPVRAELIGVAVSADGKSAGYFPGNYIPDCLKAALEDTTFPKAAHNTAYELIVSRTHGVSPKNVHDTKQMASVLRTSTTWLKGLAWTHLGLDQTQFDSVDWEDLESVVPYAGADAALTHTLFTQLSAALVEEGLWDLYEAERACIAPLAEMTLRGIKLDLAPIVALRTQLTEELVGLEEEIKVALGEINLNSGHQLARALYGPTRPTYTVVRTLEGRRMHSPDCVRKDCVDIACADELRTGAQTVLRWWAPGLAWPVKARTDGGLPATDMNTLRLYEDQPGQTFIAPLVRYKSAQRLLRNELTRWPELVQEDGRVHPMFHLAGHFEEHGQGAEAPMTGRMSSSSPNWQNVTHHGDDARPYVVEWARELRRAVVPSSSMTLWKGDIGQEEPRIGAMISEDWALLEEIDTGDVYREVAGQAFGLASRDITREQRQIGKRNWMAWLNGAGPSGIQQSAFWLSNDEAQAVIRFLQDRHPKVEAQRARLVEHLYDTGYTETWFGRRIYRPAIWSGPGPARNHAERSVMPDAIQGTAACVLKRWLSRIELPSESHMLMTIHDEIVGEANPDAIEATHRALIDALAGILPIALPLEFATGPNWAETAVVRA